MLPHRRQAPFSTHPTFPSSKTFLIFLSQSLTLREGKLLVEVTQPLKPRQRRLGWGEWSQVLFSHLTDTWRVCWM